MLVNFVRENNNTLFLRNRKSKFGAKCGADVGAEFGAEFDAECGAKIGADFGTTFERTYVLSQISAHTHRARGVAKIRLRAT